MKRRPGTRLRTAMAAVTCLLSSACGRQVQGPPGAIDADPWLWSWIDTPSTYCGDGSETGLGINPAASSDTLLIYLNGGGACWDHQSCVEDERATYVTKGFGPQAFDVYREALELGPFARDDVHNPLKDAHFAWLPYCTGDFHAGGRTIDYDGVTVRHVGYHNIGVFLERLKLTFPNLSRVILAGTSAGGYGALLNWERTQQHFAPATVYVIDDAGPLLPLPHLSAELRDIFVNNWHMAVALPDDCADCLDDPSRIHAHLAQRYPASRAALLGFTKDKIIADYLSLSDDEYISGAAALHQQLDTLPNVHYFVDSAEGHALLPHSFEDSVAGDTPLRDWIAQMLAGDPGWTSHKP